MNNKIELFFTSPSYAVVGASNNRNKYGNKVLRTYIQNNKKVIPVHPHEDKIEGLTVCHKIADLPADVKSISIITPPAVTEKIVEQAIAKGIKNIWMQPGAESSKAIAACEQHNINIIAGGECILVRLGFPDNDN